MRKRRSEKMTEIQSHPGSAVLQWWQQTPKDENGYAPLSSLIQVLEERTEIRGIAFIKRLSSSPSWEQEHGWSLELHPWRPNRVKVKTQFPLVPGPQTNFSYLKNEEESEAV